MKVIKILILLLVISINTNAQDYTEVVYLKNGSIIRGVIIEQVPGVNLKIKTGDGNVFVYQISEVEKIAKEAEERVNSSYKKIDQEGSGSYFHSAQISYGIGFGKVEGIGLQDSYSGLKITNGAWINHAIAVGLGVGAQRHHLAIYVPLTMDWRFSLSNKNFSPIINASLGYRFDPYDNQSGFIINPSFGLQNRILTGLLYYATIGVNFQEYVFENYNYATRQTETTKTFGNYFEFAVGLTL